MTTMPVRVILTSLVAAPSPNSIGSGNLYIVKRRGQPSFTLDKVFRDEILDKDEMKSVKIFKFENEEKKRKIASKNHLIN